MPLSIVYQILVDIVSSLNLLNVLMSTLQIYLPYDHILKETANPLVVSFRSLSQEKIHIPRRCFPAKDSITG